jgi:hypothetical protein
MKTSIKFIVYSGLALVVVTSSCKKQQELDTENDSAIENFLATNLTNDMANIADEAAKANTISSFKIEESNAILSSCATLHFDTLNHLNPDSIRINFGSTNCTGNDGRSRRGSLLVIYSGKYKDSLTTITIIPQNYFVNDNGISGTKTIKNLGRNTSNNLVYQFNATIAVTKANNGATFTWTCNRQREWFAGQGTLNYWLDDKYSITGSASGTNSNGRSYTSVITKPLIRYMSNGCRRYFTSGSIVHTPNNKPSRVIDFGNGTCDNLATVTINGKIYSITLN